MSTATTPTPAADLGPFIGYVWGFYGPDGIYPIEGLTLDMVATGCRVVSLFPNYGDGDSVDRENVRDYVLAHHGLTFP